MMSPAIAPSFWSQFCSALSRRSRAADAAPVSDADADPVAAQRAILSEALLANPDAFSSDLDICEFMQGFSGRL